MDAARAIARVLRGAGHEVWLVGGCVRDQFLGRRLSDIDLTTSATPVELLRLFPGSDSVGAHFGVVLVNQGGGSIEVATYRSESSYADGRHPGKVRFETDVRRDLARRDFTINALLADPFTGEVVDYVGGRADLDARLIRAIGEPAERFAEDHLRLLRAVRFAARLGFEIEPATLAAIQRLAPEIVRISTERVRDELTRMLTEGGARRAFELLDATGLLAVLLPEVHSMHGIEQPANFHPEGDVWVHTLGLLERLEQPSVVLALAALLHDVGKPPTQTFEDRIRFSGHEEVGARLTREILTRLKYPNDVIDEVAALVRQHMMFKDAPQMGESRFRRFVRQPGLETLLDLHRLDLLAADRPLDSHEFVRRRRDAIPPEQLRPAPLATGDDLIALGARPGPRFGAILHQLEDEQLEGRIVTRAEALEFLKRAWAQSST
ncbi:MAG: CCA tRNA nucleotidyltransferase [Bryobacterales bacterium]|nr:CCA tRNA nucleotidyltransferase [Bryobacterales bacterium]